MNTQPRRERLLTDDDFPHGTGRGRRLGCNPDTYECPASPTCSEAEAARHRLYNHTRNPDLDPNSTVTSQFRKRLRATLAAVGEETLLAYAGMPGEKLQEALNWPYTHIEPSLAEPFDHAWSWFVQGSNTRREDFPHGTSYGYSSPRFCRCHRCRKANRKTRANYEMGIVSPKTAVRNPRVTLHVQRLVAAGGVQAVAAATGIGREAIANMVRGCLVSAETAQKVLPVTTAQVKVGSNGLVKDPRTVTAIRSLMALGYPIRWQADKVGLKKQALEKYRAESLMPPWKHEAIQNLAATTGNRWADPVRDGILKGAIENAKTSARKQGFYPPAAYNEDGSLGIVDPVNEADARNEDRLALHLHIAYMLVSGISQDVTADKLGIERKNVQRVAAKMHLKYRDADRAYDAEQNRDITRRVKDKWNLYEIGGVGAVTACLDLGLAEYTQRLANHPEAVAWAKIDREGAV